MTFQRARFLFLNVRNGFDASAVITLLVIYDYIMLYCLHAVSAKSQVSCSSQRGVT